MTFYQDLQAATAAERTELHAAPIIGAAMAGRVNRRHYLDFLGRAFHHVKHTVPLLMACGARLPDELEWLRKDVAHYIEEEIGHHEWILNDIAAAGGQAEAVRHSQPDTDTDVLVAYAYDMVMRKNPVGMFGMVYVLEGSSVALASAAAKSLRTALDLPANAFSYLASHGALDVEHIGDFEALVNRLERPADRDAVVTGAKTVYRLYGNVLRGIDLGSSGMKLSDTTVLVTGAYGGIGAAIARELARRHAALVLTGRDPDRLATLASELRAMGAQVRCIACDLAAPGEAQALIAEALRQAGTIDTVVNCAGIQHFGFFSEESAADTERLFRINTVAPIAMVNAVLPHMLKRRSGHVVNVGSIFGSIAFPCFASYSASKFALRGFSEALRRELAGSGVVVTYVAPRFTKTPLNGAAAMRMAEALGMGQDEPADVAKSVVAEMERGGADRYLGWPEKLFVRINALFPRLVDKSLTRQRDQMRPYANAANAANATTPASTATAVTRPAL